MKNRIAPQDKELLLRCLSGEATAEEQQQAWQWIHADEMHLRYYKILQESWISSSFSQPSRSHQMERSWKKIKQKAKIGDGLKAREDIFKNSFSISMPWKRLVAAILFAFILGAAGMIAVHNFEEQNNSDAYYTIEAPRGAKSMVNLSDGSRVWLNAGSSIRYPVNFNRNNRDIYLEGEGYFIVAKNKKLAFRVHTSNLVVQAIGTEFNVKAYPEEGRVETTLVKGSVSIMGSHLNKETILMKPNQKISFYTGQPVQVASLQAHTPAVELPHPPPRIKIENNINTDVVTSWKEKRWVFSRESLGALAIKLERQYDMQVIFVDDEIKNFHLSGALEEESIEQVLQAIQLTLPIQFEVKHNIVYLSTDKKKLKNYKQLIRNQ
jgi:transmembrane sensor